MGLLNVLTDIIWRITISWRAGNLACKVIRFSQVCVTYSSTYVLVAMSIDRYDAITHPMNFSKSCKSHRKTFLIGKCLALGVTGCALCRETGSSLGRWCLAALGTLLAANSGAIRGEADTGSPTVLDRVGFAHGLADLYESCFGDIIRCAGPDYFRLLCYYC